jgi:glucose/mannose transport system substrate-binding protein
LIDLLSYNGGIWSVPVNIHRSNVMWFIPSKLQEWGVEAPATWDDFLAVCPTLQAAGVVPLEVAESWTVVQLWENIAVSMLGADGWKALWAGEKNWTDPDVVAVFDEFGKVLDCSNISVDAATLSWQQATDAVVAGKAAFNIMGDWAEGYMATTLKLEPNKDFGWAPAPGTSGTFIMLSDSFGLPKGAKNPDATIAWLKLLGSKEGQDIFNPLKGSIAARLDSDLTKYNVYSQSAAADWQSNAIVGMEPSRLRASAASSPL